jgi:hypothetical protein
LACYHPEILCAEIWGHARGAGSRQRPDFRFRTSARDRATRLPRRAIRLKRGTSMLPENSPPLSLSRFPPCRHVAGINQFCYQLPQ